MLILNVFNDFSVMSWNVKGATNKVGRRHVKNLILKYKPTLFILLETQIPFRKAESFSKGLRVQGCSNSGSTRLEWWCLGVISLLVGML